TIDEVVGYIDTLDLREQVIARLAVVEGMRPGEILALRWANINGRRIQVETRVYRGHVDVPQSRKPREAAVSKSTLAAMHQWRELSVDTSSDAFIFPSENGKTALSRDNVWRRQMKPKLDNVDLGWATFQVLRKTNASLLSKLRSDPKVGAD